MLTSADLVAMLVLSTMLLPSNATNVLKSDPFPPNKVRSGCSPVLTSRCAANAKKSLSLTTVSRRARTLGAIWQQVAVTVARMTSEH